MTETTHIFGLDFAPEHYDRLSFRHIRPAWLACEAPLMMSKWWDYRLMDPCAATYLYAHHYKREYVECYRRTIDGVNYKHIRPLKHADLFLNPQNKITAIWRGRQFADALGMPYDLYIRWALESRLSYWSRAYLPRPQLLYSELVTDKVTKRWIDYLGGFLMGGKHEVFKNENYAGLPMQDEHHEWLCEQAGKRANAFSVIESLVKNGYLPIEKIRSRYGDEAASRVLEAA